MILKNNKRGQAAIEFLMTYGWMLLVVLIVGALIFSFVDFGSLLPNRLELSNNLRGDPTGSIAYSKDSSNSPNENQVKVVFRYNGAKKALVDLNNSQIETELGDNCAATALENLDVSGSGITDSSATTTVNFLNSQDGLMSFNCSGVSGGGLLAGDTVSGNIKIYVVDPKSNLRVPSSGAIRLQIS